MDRAPVRCVEGNAPLIFFFSYKSRNRETQKDVLRALLIMAVVVENEGFSGTAVELGVNVGSVGRSFSRLGASEDQSLTRYENPTSDVQDLQENAQQSVQAQQQQSAHQNQQSQLSVRLHDQNLLKTQHLQQSSQSNQQSLLQNLEIQQMKQNAQQKQLSFQPNQLRFQQLQQNSHQNQNNMEQNVHIQHSQHSLQQNHQNVQLLHMQQSAMRNVNIQINPSTQGLQHQAVLANPALSASEQHQQRANGAASHEKAGLGTENAAASQDFSRDMRELEDLLSKLNPMAKEFVPPSLVNHSPAVSFFNAFMKKNNYQGKRRMNSRTNLAQQEDSIRRTVYVSDIDQQVTEEQLAALFINCGQVVDCRVCGDPNSVLRFAFVEFTDEESARAALSLAGTMLGYYPVRVLPSKTAIAPVNPTFLPRSEDEREMCARTIYCTNIDKKVSQADVKLFFESLCGEVSRLRLLGDYHHSTRIAFVEFVMAESAIAALNCSGAILGSLPIRVSPSKTPVRPRNPRSLMH